MRSSSPPKGVPAITRHFAPLRDPRVVGRSSYPLETVLVIALLGVMCGAEGYEDLATFAASKASWLATFLEMPGRPPKEKVFRRVFEAILPGAFEACMRSWVQSLAASVKGQVVAFDGKALRGALRKGFGRTALHQVHAWVGAQHLLLAKEAVEGAPEEGAAIRAMLDALELQGAIVTMDAGNTAQETAQKVIDRHADYVITLKANRKKFYLGVRGFFEAAEADGFKGVRVRHLQTRDHGHGRDEVRDVWVVAASALGEIAAHWPGIQSVVMIRRTRVLTDGTVQQWTHFYLSSLPPRVRRLAEVIREHWSVENGLHWILDVQMREDDCMIRDPHSATNFAALRRMALMLIKRDDTTDRGVRGKQKKAGWDNDYLLHLLTRGLTENEAV